MKIAITGSNGLIGKNCIVELKKKFEIVALVRSTGNIGEKCSNVQYVKTDYSIENLMQVLNDVEGIVHLAAQKMLKDDDRGVEGYLPSIITLENVIKSALKLGITNIINFSSRCVYGEYSEEKYKENTKTMPINFYGVSKIMGEQLCEYYNDRYNMKIKNFRLAQVIDGGTSIQEKNMFNIFLQKAKQNNIIEIWGNGMDFRDYIYIKDVCRGIENGLLHPNQSGIYNIGSGIGVCNKTMAETIIKEAKSKSEIVYVKNKNVKNCKIILDVNKAKNELGFQCKYSMEGYIKDVLDATGKPVNSCNPDVSGCSCFCSNKSFTPPRANH